MNQPWHFDNHLFLIKVLYGAEQPSIVAIETTYFWIRAYDVPLLLHNEHSLRLLAKGVGHLIAYEKPTQLEVKKILKFRVDINVSKPLLRAITIRCSGEDLWVSLKYESLPSFCFCCGVHDHFYRACTLG
ncbi:hypothetical protein ACS0TY_029532 [Phlomoides rotata]